MIKIKRIEEVENIELDETIKKEIHLLLEYLDEHYGKNRDHEKDDGGYAVVLEKGDLDNKELDFFNKIASFEAFDENKTYFYGLLLINNEFGIDYYIPKINLTEEEHKKICTFL